MTPFLIVLLSMFIGFIIGFALGAIIQAFRNTHDAEQAEEYRRRLEECTARYRMLHQSTIKNKKDENDQH